MNGFERKVDFLSVTTQTMKKSSLFILFDVTV